MLPLILYHRGCADGSGAAFAAWRKFGDAAEYLAVQYGEAPPADDVVHGRDVYVLDFSYPREVTEHLHEVTGGRLAVVDHHKTSAEALAGLSYARFDMGHSGAVLAWQYFHGDAPVPEVLLYVEDRDLWHWQLPKSKEISAALVARGVRTDFKLFDGIERQWQPHQCPPGEKNVLVREGEALLRGQAQYVDAICRNAEVVALSLATPGEAGRIYTLAVVNAPVLQSEVGHDLCERLVAVGGTPRAAVWYYDGRSGKYRVSLRSVGDVDVSAIAKTFPGGGGHKNAAGFECDALPWVRVGALRRSEESE